LEIVAFTTKKDNSVTKMLELSKSPNVTFQNNKSGFLMLVFCLYILKVLKSWLKTIRLYSLSVDRFHSFLHAIQTLCPRKRCSCLSWLSEFQGTASHL